MSCPKCGRENSPPFKFCGDCGAALLLDPAAQSSSSAQDAPAIRVTSEREDIALAADGERKTVTALFADITGSMDLMEDLDPEEARAIVDPALKLMMDAVRRYDGYIVQSTGDGVFALFGAPVAHEEHPQRALYAALAMQEELKRYSDRNRAEGRAPLQVRVGVNTGQVVVRSIKTNDAHTEYTPIGHSTSLAARMQALAPIGSIATTAGVRNLCKGYFVFKVLGPIKVKGVSEPVEVYEVTGLGPLRTRLQRSAGRGFTKFVGREREMEAMRAAAEQAKSGRGQIVAAMAEAGSGKSRLIFEFKATSQPGWRVLETFSVSHGTGSAYLPVIDLLHGYFGIDREDDAPTRRKKIKERVFALDGSEDTLPYLFALLGIIEGEDPLAGMDAQIKRKRTLDAIKRIILRESLNQPLMLIFEDLHWIDSETQAFLNLLADSLASSRILLLVNYRPEYQHEWGGKTYYTQLRLDPLSKDSADDMLSAMLGDEVELAPLKRLIIEKTEGNPFFMEETVQVMFDEGTLVRDGTVKLTKPLSQLRIPPTVQAILASRIDRLPSVSKNLLQTLAVMGKEFPLALVRAVSGKPDDELNAILTELQAGEFIYERPPLADVEFVFKHALTQEVAYASLLNERRKILHEQIGIAIEALFADSLSDHLNQLAYHYGRSSNTRKAVEYLALAAKRELTQSAYQGALGHIQSAMNLLANLPESQDRSQQELDLRIDHGHALLAVNGWYVPEVGTTYRRARELCQQLALAGDPRLFSVVFGLWTYHLTRGEHRDARYFAEESQKLADQLGDTNLMLRASWALGCSQHCMGEMTDAHDTHDRAIRSHNSESHAGLFVSGQDPLMSCLHFEAVTLWILGRLNQSRERGREADRLARKLGHPFTLQWYLTLDAMFCQIRRDYSSADARIAEAMPICEEYGFEDSLTMLRGLQMMSLVGQGKIDVSLAVAPSEAAKVPEGRDLFQSWARGALAEALVRQGNPSFALAVLDQAFELVDRVEERFFEAELHRIRGEAAILLDIENGDNDGRREPTRGERSLRQAIAIAHDRKAQMFKLRAATSLSRLQIKMDQHSAARETLLDAYNSFTGGFECADLTEARDLLRTFD